MKQSQKIKSVSDAIEAVHFCGFEKGQLLFRGQVNYHWAITPLLFRVADSVDHAVYYETTTLLPLFVQLKLPYLHSSDPLEHLMIAQHFGIPTRLLDWSYDILIALFFACYDEAGDYSDVDGSLFLLDATPFKVFPTNSSKQRVFKKPFDPSNSKIHSQRLSIDDIHIVNPLIRNPRMRVQEGCFLILPWQYSVDDPELLTFQRYIQEQRKFVEEHNKTSDEKWQPIFLAAKRVCHESKKSILRELDEKYGISDKTILIDSRFTKEIVKNYSALKEHVETKSRDLVKSKQKP